MSWSRFLLTCLVISALALPASAGIFFNRQPKPKPEVRVPELIVIVKTDPNEHKRSAAAAELRQFDVKAFPDIVPILVDVVHNDTHAAVRYEAAVSLSRIRPVSQEAGMALEHAAAHDAVLYVRMQARTSLVYYRLSGYRTLSQPKDIPQGKQAGGNKGEPPLAPSEVSPKNNRPAPQTNSKKVVVPPVKTTPTAALPDPSIPRRLPAGPPKSPLVPVDAPKLKPTPSQPQEEGPPLVPRQ